MDVVAAVEPEVAEPPERAFPAESVYPLLVAEFAIRRQDYQTALDNYLEQSSILEDSGIASHTTHLAQFMQKDAQSLRAAQLWLEQEPDNLEAHNTAATAAYPQAKALPVCSASKMDSGSKASKRLSISESRMFAVP